MNDFFLYVINFRPFRNQSINFQKKKNLDGDFVLKLFDVFTPFTGGIVWILYRHFEKICIIKPLSSRPANSERYL